eukprot:SAG31_NODE_3922_length_3749_cov_4.089315_2_plen_345_part_00
MAALICTSSQTAFMTHRYLTDNLHTLVDMLCYCEDNGIEGVAISADALKFYDRVCPTFTLKCVKAAFATMVPHTLSLTSWVDILHAGGLRAVMINGCLSEWFELQSGLPQGSPLSCLLSAVVEQPKATLLAMSKHEMREVRQRWHHIPEVATLASLVKIPGPAGMDGVPNARYVEVNDDSNVRYADDLYMFIARPDRNVRMFFYICDVCGLGSGTDNNMQKTMVQLIGVNRVRATWLMKELDLLWIKEGELMEVTGLTLGYSKDLRKSLWTRKIAKVVNSLRSWAHVSTSQLERALLFRTFALSVWSKDSATKSAVPSFHFTHGARVGRKGARLMAAWRARCKR